VRQTHGAPLAQSIIFADDVGASISFMYLGTRYVLGAVYIRPQTPVADWVDISQFIETCDIIIGDFNARLPGPMLTRDGECNHGRWLSNFITLHGFTQSTPDEPRFWGVSTIDHCISRHPMNSQYHYRAGLEHAGVFFRLQADLPPDMMRKRPDWNKCNENELAVGLCELSEYAPNERWGKLRLLVDELPRRRAGLGQCKFWNNELEKMRLDVRRACRSTMDHPENRSDYNLVSCVYRVSLLQHQYDHIRTVLARAKDPAVFRLLRLLETK